MLFSSLEGDIRNVSKVVTSGNLSELSIILTSCLTAIKYHVKNIGKLFLREMVKIYFGLLKTQVRFLTN